MNPRLAKIMEMKYGEKHSQSRLEEFNRLVLTCPGIDPTLIAHLRKLFDNPRLKADNPLLAQMLMVQHGVNLVLDYLDTRYREQSAAAIKELGR